MTDRMLTEEAGMGRGRTSPFGVKLRQHRVEAGFTQEELAERALVSARVISDLERGVSRTPRFHTVRQLAEALQLSPADTATFLETARAPSNRPENDWEPDAGVPNEAPVILFPEVGGRVPERREFPVGGYLGSLPPNRLVGREAEVGRTIRLAGAAASGKGKLVLLVGEPGAGKTRLAQELTLSLQNSDFLIATGRCYGSQRAVPYYPFVEALGALYASTPDDIRRAVPAQWAELARLLPALGLPVPDSSGAPDQQRLFWTVTSFVRALATRAPVAILLDDLHWADASSLEFLQHLARHTTGDRVLLLGTYRDVEVNRQHPLEAALRDLNREGLMERIEIRRLSREETRRLIAAVMDEDDINEEFAEVVYRRTEGNPFFIQQVLRVMVERGDLFREGGHWCLKSLDEIEVPESVRSVVGQRLMRLREGTQGVLREASILGQTFNFDDLQRVSGLTERDLEDALEEAAAAGMVREVARDAYAFDHALTQGTLYGELSSRRRRRLHLAAGEGIAALPPELRDRRAAELARHFLEGDDPPRALEWSIAAGDRAEHVFAHSDARSHYGSALQLAEEISDRTRETEAREKLARTLALLAHYDQALELFETAATSYREGNDFEGEIRVMAAIGRILFERTRWVDGIERLQPILERQEQSGLVSAGTAALCITLAELHWLGGHAEQALELIEQAIEVAGAVGDRRLLGLAECRRGVILNDMGRSDEALDAYTQSIPLSKAVEDLDTLIRTLSNRSMIYSARGQYGEAEHDREEAVHLARRLGDPTQIGWVLGTVAWRAWTENGDPDRARALLAEMESVTGYMRGTRSSFFIPSAAVLRLMTTEDEAALRELEALSEEGKRASDFALWGASQHHIADWDLMIGRPTQARDRWESLLVSRRAVEQHYGATSGLGRAYLACGEIDRAERVVEEYLATAARSGAEAFAIVRGVEGAVRAAQGRPDDARAAFEDALAYMRTHRVPWDHGRTALAYGRLCAAQGNGVAARKLFEEALAAFRLVRVQPLIRETQRALDDLR